MNGNNKRDLKAFVRYDGSGRVVAGSLILRRKKPKVGNWKEVQGYECCTDHTLTTTVATSITNFVIKFFCGGNEVAAVTLTSGVNSSSVANLVSLLNTMYPLLGTFTTTGGTNVTLVMTDEQKKAICPESESISFTVTAAPVPTTTTTTTTATPTTTTTTTTVAPTTTTTTTT